MYHKSKIVLIAAILFSGQTILAQTPVVLDNFENTLAKSGLSESTSTKIKNLIATRNQTLAENKKLQEEQEASYPIAFQDPETTPKFVHQQFSKSLSEIITIDQFKKLFLPQVQARITKKTNDKLVFFKNKYKLTLDQENKLKALLFDTTVNEVMAKEYYKYDDSISNGLEEKIKSDKKEQELITSFGFLYSKNKKTDFLIQKLQEAGVEATRINKLITALQNQQQKTLQQDKIGRVNEDASVFDFFEEVETKRKINMDLLEELSKIITIAEFKTVFLQQLQAKIDGETQKEWAALKANYQLTQEHYAELLKLIQEKQIEMVVTEAYYKFNTDLYQQKLRAVEYRHGKAILETILKLEALEKPAAK
jgi:hypothetical protein